MAMWARMVVARGLATDAKLQLNSTDDATNMLIDDLVFAQSKSVRTSTIILASFNVLAAFFTALSILYDCYWASKRCNPKFKASQFCVSKLHPAETFPLILSFGIVIQGLIFAAAQGQGMQRLYEDGCDIIAQYMLPAIFLLPFIQVVFGLECALRSVRKIPFRARGKYDVTICLGVIFVLLVGSWVPTFLFKQPTVCFASLLWFVSSFGMIAFITLAVALGLMIISAITIFSRLSGASMVGQHQRIAASRMVYYLVIGIVSMSLVIPYFATQALWPRGDLKLAMMGTVVVNLQGLMNGLLHLFLRSNTSTSAFGPKHGRHWAREKHEIRLWGPNELAFTNHLNDPVSGPQSPQSIAEKLRSESQTSLVRAEKTTLAAMASPPFRSPGKTPPFPITPLRATATNEKKAEPTRQSSVQQHARKTSYSLFPTNENKLTTRPAAPVASIYDITNLAPPPKIQFGLGNRRSSIVSTATVQIGLRLSQAPGTEEAPLLPAMRDTTSSNSLLLPIAFGGPRPSSPTVAPLTLSSKKFGQTGSTYNPKRESLLRKVPSPLQVTSTTATLRPSTADLSLRSPRWPAPPPVISSTVNTNLTPTMTPGTTSNFNKDLPPTPGLELNPLVEALRISKTQIPSAIYSPGGLSTGRSDLEPIHGLPSGPKCAKLLNSGSNTPATPNVNSPRLGSAAVQKRDWI